MADKKKKKTAEDVQENVFVLTPNEHFNGVRNGVKFKDGRAVCSMEEAVKLRDMFGYKIAQPELGKAETGDKE